ncbi:MAG: hypothetical protein IFNCLDLE_00407 [Ignavibacteriaceae bacterium]|nr:hypothetical protein [Ignavibacteriaceae bacterium]
MPVSKLSEAVRNRELDLALIPPLDLHNGGDFCVSGNLGIVSDGAFSNNFLYFKPGEQTVPKITLKGDLSFHDITLLRIVFRELYGIDPETEQYEGDIGKVNNLLVAGDDNYLTGRFELGMNIVEEAVECLNFPLISYILVSSVEETLEAVHRKVRELNDSLYEFGSDYISTTGVSERTLEYLSENLHHLSFELNDEIIEALKSLISTPYYFNLTEDIPEFTLV